MTEFFPNAREKIERWAFNGTFGKNFGMLFDLQMWCLGCDIRHPRGNLLLEHGFRRQRPGETYGSSHYHKSVDGRYEMHLWGFAVVMTDGGSALSLRRHERAPVVSETEEIAVATHRPQDLPRFRTPATTESRTKASKLLFAVAEELVRYEQSVASRMGPDYRRKCIAASPAHKKQRTITLAEKWGDIVQALRSLGS